MLVSVIIPAYNREDTIEQAVRSVLDQDYKDIELIVVDDCSTDGTVQCVKKIEDDRLRVIESEVNGGACVARNKGIDAARGELIAFQDSDDIWHKDKLSKCVEAIEREQADFVFSAFLRVESTSRGEKREVIPGDDFNQAEDKLDRILRRNCVSTQTIVAKRAVFDKVRFDPRMKRFQDWDLTIGVIRAGFSVYFVKEPLVSCYVQSDSISKDGEKAYHGFRMILSKYGKEYAMHPDSKKECYLLAGVLVEKQGGNGADFFLRYYQMEKNPKNWVRYFLSRIRLYNKLSH